MALVCVLACPLGRASDTASDLFGGVKDLVFQIRVIDIASGDRYSIGSGFLVGGDGLVATNFHVVSSFALEPGKFRLEFVSQDGSTGPLQLLAVDVVHDLAITSTGDAVEAWLPLAPGDLSKGERIYSLGNPLDLGMTIIEGTYNGLVENSRYRKILFSGSLNPGMSGGPALNQAGEVIGVNVSKGGEAISFLVPAEHVQALLQEVRKNSDSTDFRAAIGAALLADQQAFFDAILDADLQTRELEDLRIPGRLHDSLKCWGHTVDEEDIRYAAVHRHCKSEDEIYITDSLYVGDFFADYEVISSDELNPLQFYHLLEERFDHRTFSNAHDSEEVTDFECHGDRLALPAGNWKVSTCLRAYKRYAGLYDASMVMASLDYDDHAAVVKVGATGISLDNALALFRRIAGALQWTR